MGTSKLALYNKALGYLEERKLASLAENRESRRAMDDEYDDNNLYCVSQGNWNHAIRMVELDAELTQVPNFGPAYAFKKPSDWNHTFQVSDNESFDPLLRNFQDQNGYWFTDITPIYVKYVSNDVNYGLNLGLWTPAYVEYVSCRLAFKVCPRLKQSMDKIKSLKAELKSVKAEAVSTDSQDNPPGKPPYGTWVMSRAPRGSILPIGSPFAGNDD